MSHVRNNVKLTFGRVACRCPYPVPFERSQSEVSLLGGEVDSELGAPTESTLAIYEEVITELKELRTLTAHVTRLGKLMNGTTDSQLKALLGTAVSFLQAAHKSPNVKGKTTPTAIYEYRHPQIQQLRSYCEALLSTNKPDWQVEAERHGWTANWQAEATRHGWTPP